MNNTAQDKPSEMVDETAATAADDGVARRPEAWRIAALATFAVVLTGAFSLALIALVRHALRTEMHSHVVLIPFVTGWLLWTERDELHARLRTSTLWALGFALLGALLLSLRLAPWAPELSQNDHLAVLVGSYLGFLMAGVLLFLGRDWAWKAMFPLGFLVFMIPLPNALEVAIEQWLMVASAEASDWLFSLIGTPFYRDGQYFHLPGFSMEVAQECSGIRSSWVLFITSLLASHLFLRTKWRKFLLVAFVLPLGVVRNAFRILTIGLLCVHVSPKMIDSWIHHKGGPLFFAASLVPFFALLWWFRRGERRSRERREAGAKKEDPATASAT